jgi:anaerobic selenocysteine-containing dehydrogenase
MTEGEAKSSQVEKKGSLITSGTERTVLRTVSFSGTINGGAEGAVDVRNGKIVRIRPLHYDWKFDKADLNPWKFTKNGKSLEPNWKSLPGPFSLAYKKRVYSPNRIKYPLKRVDWDPNGERNPQNRGKSKYKRISWDEATDIIASEIKRVHKEYGPFAVLTQGDGHGECKLIQGPHGAPSLLLEKMGVWTQQVRNADSWEGWVYGGEHMWGKGLCGHMLPAANIVKDVSENSNMVLFWGGDPETTPWGFRGQFASRVCYFWTEIGIKQVYICPELNYGAAVHADKWIPVLPNTDAALQLAITYVWMTEGTYDKEYIKTHSVGFDKFEDYVLGREDGIPKTPEWASLKCGVPEWTIKALAREFATKATTIAHYFGGGYIRGPFSHEPARLEGVLLAMQGLGRPGVHQCIITYLGMPRSVQSPNTRYTWGGSYGDQAQRDRVLKLTGACSPRLGINQFFPKTLFKEAILNPPVTFWGTSGPMAPTEDQFVQYTYPWPKEEGGAEVHMIWCDNPCLTTCWNFGHKLAEVYRSPKIEFIVTQHPWLENDTMFADIILPISTLYEMDDIITNTAQGVQFKNIIVQRQAIDPIGESKSDYEAVLEVARKLGKYDEVTEGKTLEDWIKYVYEGMGLPEFISWEDFKEKQYYVFPVAEDWEKDPPGLRQFYENPEKYPLETPSGKLEIYSERLAEHFPDDKERQPIPKWVENSESHNERISSERADKYPLLMMSNHGRWRVHAQCDDITWTREIRTCKVKGWDGYMYEPLWIHPSTAGARGIKDGDIVKIYNERGSVLGGAIVWERMMPGVVYMDHGARVDWIVPGEIDRGGAINLISPNNIISKHCPGMATSSYLVEVEKVSMTQMEEWKKQYPEAFAREYDPASGLRFNAWVEGDI